MTPVTLIVGFVLLFLGRRVFWLFVAATGFLAGTVVAAEFMQGQPDAAALAVALGAGVIGGLLAVFLQKVAIVLAGLLAGAYLGQALAPALPATFPAWLPIVIGAVVGVVLLTLLFEWTLAALSSLLGAAVLAQSVPMPSPWPTVIFVVLVVLGLAVQTRGKRAKPDRSKDPEPRR